jgi:hypothetical protein
MDLIVHPIISCLIDVKWNAFARFTAWVDLLITIVYLSVWYVSYR